MRLAFGGLWEVFPCWAFYAPGGEHFSIFQNRFFLVFSSAPGFPRWSFYAARGEHLWSFLGNVIPQLLQRNLKKCFFFYHKIEDFGVFWGYGPRWGPGLESSWQKGVFPGQKNKRFWKLFWHLFGILAEVFLSVFSDAFLFCTLGGFRA